MAWADQLVNLNPQLGVFAPTDKNLAYAGNYPLFEQQTPAYPYPNPYNLAIQGFRRNELIFACVRKRMNAISEPPIQVLDNSDEKNPKSLPQHKLRLLLKNPIKIYEQGQLVFVLNEKEFWKIVECYLSIAGFAAFEMEFNRLGEVVNLFPMRPDWCSMRRGERNPLKYIRYQPYGLPYADIPMSRILYFSYFDPVFPLLKALSPTAVASRSMSVDNSTTDFLQIFFQRGALIQGLLKSDQQMSNEEAMRYRNLWNQQHGGNQNWAENNIAVLGSGIAYQSIQMNMRDMAFPEIDARAETHICEAFEMPAILVGAKVGAENAHLNVYQEANAAWYNQWVSPELDYLDSTVEAQLLPKFEEADTEKFIVAFDTSKVKALQEDEDKKHARAREDTKAGLLTRAEGREIIGKEDIDDGEEVWLNVTVRALDTGGLVEGGLGAHDTTGAQGQSVSPEQKAAKELEKKQFKQFVRHGRDANEFKFKYLDETERTALMRPFATKALPNDYDTLRADYRKAVVDLLTGYIAGKMTENEFNSKSSSLIRENISQAYHLGNESQGGESISQDEIDSIVSKEIDNLKNAKADNLSEAQIEQRAELYARTLDATYSAAALGALAALDMLEFGGIDGIESCPDCQRLKGQRMPKQWWVANGLIPGIGNDNFACGGWRCKHGLYDRFGRRVTL